MPFDTNIQVKSGVDAVKTPSVENLKIGIKPAFSFLKFVHDKTHRIDVAFVSRNPVTGVVQSYKKFLLNNMDAPVSTTVDKSKSKITNFTEVNAALSKKDYALVIFYDDKDSYLKEFLDLGSEFANWKNRVAVLSNASDGGFVAKSIMNLIGFVPRTPLPAPRRPKL